MTPIFKQETCVWQVSIEQSHVVLKLGRNGEAMALRLSPEQARDMSEILSKAAERVQPLD